MNNSVANFADVLQKFSLAGFDDLEWTVQEEMPDFCVRNGDPTMKMSVMIGDGESAGTIAAWSCDRDGFTYTNLPSAEAAFLLEGVARITEAGTGVVTEVRAGEAYRLPVGWSGSWEAVEPVRKVYLFL